MVDLKNAAKGRDVELTVADSKAQTSLHGLEGECDWLLFSIELNGPNHHLRRFWFQPWNNNHIGRGGFWGGGDYGLPQHAAKADACLISASAIILKTNNAELKRTNLIERNPGGHLYHYWTWQLWLRTINLFLHYVQLKEKTENKFH